MSEQNRSEAAGMSMRIGAHLMEIMELRATVTALQAKLEEAMAAFAQSHEVLFVRHIERHLNGDQVPTCQICGANIYEIHDAHTSILQKGHHDLLDDKARDQNSNESPDHSH